MPILPPELATRVQSVRVRASGVRSRIRALNPFGGVVARTMNRFGLTPLPISNGTKLLPARPEPHMPTQSPATDDSWPGEGSAREYGLLKPQLGPIGVPGPNPPPRPVAAGWAEMLPANLDVRQDPFANRPRPGIVDQHLAPPPQNAFI